MRVELEYGRGRLPLEVPDEATVVTGRKVPALVDEQAAVREALRMPIGSPSLAELAAQGRRAVVVFPDQTRPMPNRTVLPPLLAELEAAGLAPGDITLLCATGTHRGPTSAELDELIGRNQRERYRAGIHEDAISDHVAVGEVDGVPVALDRRYVEADVRVVTGFVEPHVFAGFSGGPKAVCPGVAARETILAAHSPARIASRDATWLKTVGNPVHDFIRAAAACCPPSFSVDVTINSARQLTAVFAGDLWQVHAAARSSVGETVVQRVGPQYDIVVSTNGGYPLDRNLYQCIKGLSAAERVVRPGGTILMAADCVDGLPPEGDFANILRGAPSLEALMDGSARPRLDYWSAQVLARVLTYAEVSLFSAGLSNDDLAIARLRRIDDLQAELRQRLRKQPQARVCVLPRGPLTVASTPE